MQLSGYNCPEVTRESKKKPPEGGFLNLTWYFFKSETNGIAIKD